MPGPPRRVNPEAAQCLVNRPRRHYAGSLSGDLDLAVLSEN
jgi:hypothetical protein